MIDCADGGQISNGIQKFNKMAAILLKKVWISNGQTMLHVLCLCTDPLKSEPLQIQTSKCLILECVGYFKGQSH